MKIRLRSAEEEYRHAAGRTAEVAETDPAQPGKPTRKRTHEPERSTSTSREAEP